MSQKEFRLQVVEYEYRWIQCLREATIKDLMNMYALEWIYANPTIFIIKAESEAEAMEELLYDYTFVRPDLHSFEIYNVTPD